MGERECYYYDAATAVPNAIFVLRALESDASQIQELCLSIIPGFAGEQKTFV